MEWTCMYMLSPAEQIVVSRTEELEDGADPTLKDVALWGWEVSGKQGGAAEGLSPKLAYTSARNGDMLLWGQICSSLFPRMVPNLHILLYFSLLPLVRFKSSWKMFLFSFTFCLFFTYPYCQRGWVLFFCVWHGWVLRTGLMYCVLRLCDVNNCCPTSLYFFGEK